MSAYQTERGYRMLGEKLLKLRKKCGYSQQTLADALSVTRQTISNWESGQGAPTLDKAIDLAKLYHISLDDLLEDQVEVVVKEKKQPSRRLLQLLEGKDVKLSCDDLERWIEMGFDFGYSETVKVLQVSEEWMRIEYTRTKENHLLKKEKVVKLIDINAINGIEIVEVSE